MGSAALYSLREGISNHIVDLRCLPTGRLVMRIQSSGGCLAYRAQASLRDEQPVAAISAARLASQFAFSTPGRPDDVLAWNFGDGTRTPIQLPVHEFKPGGYAVTLEARNVSCNITSRDTLRVDVVGLERLEPRRLGVPERLGRFTLNLYGGGFDQQTEVALVRGGTVVLPERSAARDRVELSALYNLRQVDFGTYDVRIKFGNGEIILVEDGLLIEQEAVPVSLTSNANELPIEVSIAGSQNARVGGPIEQIINVYNPNGRDAVGVTIGIVLPRGFQTDLVDVMQLNTADVTIAGQDWNLLSIEPKSFADTYFEGSLEEAFLPVALRRQEMYDNLDLIFPIMIDTLYGEALVGDLYEVYLPFVGAASTRALHFRVTPQASANFPIRAYAWPGNLRTNPISDYWLSVIHDGGLQAAAMLENTGIAPFKVLGKAAGTIDIVSQVVFTEGFDLVNGTNVADATYYKKQGVALTAEAASQLAGKHFSKVGDQAEFARGQMKHANEHVTTINKLVRKSNLGEGFIALDPKTAAQLGKQLKKYQDVLTELGPQASNLARQEALAEIAKWSAAKGIKLTEAELKELINNAQLADCLQNPNAPGCENVSPSTNRPDPKSRAERELLARQSRDPNAIYGPDGAGEQRFIRRAGAQTYTVAFENVDSAEIAAQVVRVELDLDPAVYDLGRTVLGDITIGGQTYFLPDGRTELYRDIDLRPSQPFVVRLSAKLDTVTGAMRYTYATLDPTTLDVPADAFAGFLPPNVANSEGEGTFTFTTFLRPGLNTGDTARAEALIYFDDNDPIVTNTWINVVDESRPRSAILKGARLSNDSTLVLNYGGNDAGSGIAEYVLRMRPDGGQWLNLDMPVPVAGEAEVTLDPAIAYDFYVVATDAVGLREVKDPVVELRVAAGQVTVGVPDLQYRTPRITLYPNPASASQNSVLRSNVDLARATLELFDGLGRRVRSMPVELSAGGEVQLPTAGLAAGMYLVRVTDGAGSEVAAQLVVR